MGVGFAGKFAGDTTLTFGLGTETRASSRIVVFAGFREDGYADSHCHRNPGDRRVDHLWAFLGYSARPSDLKALVVHADHRAGERDNRV